LYNTHFFAQNGKAIEGGVHYTFYLKPFLTGRHKTFPRISCWIGAIKQFLYGETIYLVNLKMQCKTYLLEIAFEYKCSCHNIFEDLLASGMF
jgi:hypothetical protein